MKRCGWINLASEFDDVLNAERRTPNAERRTMNQELGTELEHEPRSENREA